MSVEIWVGPKAKHCKEIESLEEVMAAWAAQRPLVACLRRGRDITCKKRVGLLLEDAKTVLDALHHVVHRELGEIIEEWVRFTYWLSS